MRPLFVVVLLALGCRSGPVPWRPSLSIAWEKNILSIRGPGIPGGEVRIWYLEAYCRSGSTDRDWRETVIPHSTEKLFASPDGTSLRLRCRVQGGVEVDHDIRAGEGEVDFRVQAVHRGMEYVDAVWVQPCIRVGDFTGGDKESYVSKCFIFLDGRRTFLDRTRARVAPRARYTPGQVFVPAGIDRNDVNPRPLSPDVPSNGLIGCVSADGARLLATAWEPYQELFQGVIACIHSDFRLGGLRPGETKRARGKIYIMENDVSALLARYRRDFPEQAGSASR
ncbi:MAG: hypothetical protein ACK44W_07980 [Planctomycetota bacterium]